MRREITKRMHDLERRLSPRPKIYVIDASRGDADALCDAYYAATPIELQAEIVIVIVDATDRSQSAQMH